MTSHRPDAHHGQAGEAAHGAAVVVAGDADDGVIELGRDVEVRYFGRDGGASGVVGEVDSQEGLFVADVEEIVCVVQVLHAVREGFWAAESRDKRGHVLRDVEGVEPA